MNGLRRATSRTAAIGSIPDPNAALLQPSRGQRGAIGNRSRIVQKFTWLFVDKWITLQARPISVSEIMSRDVIKSQWTRLQGKLRAKWSKLTYDDVMFAEGDRVYLIGRLKERYGLSADAAQLQVAQFERLLY
jgi:uncharacterized protein YjbJ (UPF0337 family)